MRKYTVAGIVLIAVLALRFFGLLGAALNLFSGHLLVALFYLILAAVFAYAFMQLVRRNANGVLVTMAAAIVDLLAIIISYRNLYGLMAAVIDLVLLYFAWLEYKNQNDAAAPGTDSLPPAAPAV